MYRALRFGINLTLIILITGLMYPLIVFALEIMHNPYIVTISIDIQSIDIEKRKAVVNITISYKGSIPINDVHVKILDNDIPIGSLSKNVTKIFQVEIELEDNIEGMLKSFEIEFKLANLYKFSIVQIR